MQQEQRHIYYDNDLKIEAYNLTGIVQPFPTHFHNYYVIGFVEGGCRHLWCNGMEYDLSAGDLVLFNPKDCHRCAPLNGELLDYRAININRALMEKAAEEITGERFKPSFTSAISKQSDITSTLNDLYSAIINRSPKMEREELFYILLDLVLREHSTPFEEKPPEPENCRVKAVQEYLESHFDENIALDDLCGIIQLSKSQFLKVFTKQTGLSPYRYLQSVRIERARKLLEKGVPPVEAAFQAGFSDQSHFSRYFKGFIGLPPKQYQRIFQLEENQGPKEVQCNNGGISYE